MMPLVLRVRGSPEEMGRQHGYLLKGEIHQRLQAAWSWWRRYMEQDSGQRLNWLRQVHLLVREFQRWGGPAWEEWQALARAAQVSREDLMLLTAWQDYRELWGARAAAPVPTGGCTAAVLRPPATESGAWIAMNWDAPEPLGEPVHLFCRQPEDGPTAIVLAPAGGLPVAGINEAGLAFAWVDRACREALPRLPTGVVFTEIAHLSHLDAAVRALRETPRASGLAAALVDGSTHATVVELATDRSAEHHLSHHHPLWALANHYQSTALQPLDAWPNRAASEGRQSRLLELLEQCGTVHAPERLQTVFADHHPNTGEPICQHQDTPHKTFAFIALLPAQRELAYTVGPPCQAPLSRLPLS